MVYLPALRSGSATTSKTVRYATGQPTGKHESVVAIERDQARDREKRSCAHVIACDRDAVLPAGDAARSDHPCARAVAYGDGGVSPVMANPSLQLFSRGTLLASNDDWGTNGNAAQIAAKHSDPG